MNNLLRHLKYRKIGSESSRCIYGNAVYAFCHHTDKLPDELVALEKVDVEKLVENFCYHKMENGWRSPRTANTTLFMLKTFFKVNGFRGSKKLEIDCFHQSARERTRPEYIPTLDEARGMANVAGSLRNRAIILFILSAGLRNSTLRALLYGEVKEELEAGATNILIKVHKGMKKIVHSACKSNTEYSVFISSEAAEALRLYLNDRRRFGEIHDEEVLFCSEHNRLSRKERVIKPLTARELQIIIKTAARKAGIKDWKNVVPHCLRKTFDSISRSRFADGGTLDLKTQEYFIGHILGGSMDTYFDKTKVDELRKEYAKLIFRPQEQAKVDFESLQNIAGAIGIDCTQLEESKKKELGRALSDVEKFNILQEAFKQTARVLKSINNSIPETTSSANGQSGISLNNPDLTGETQLTPANVETKDALSPKTSLQESVKPLNKKVFTSPIKNNEMRSTQLTLFIMAQEDTHRIKSPTRDIRQLKPKDRVKTDLSSFLQYTS